MNVIWRREQLHTHCPFFTISASFPSDFDWNQWYWNPCRVAGPWWIYCIILAKTLPQHCLDCPILDGMRVCRMLLTYPAVVNWIRAIFMTHLQFIVSACVRLRAELQLPAPCAWLSEIGISERTASRTVAAPCFLLYINNPPDYSFDNSILW